MEREIAFTAYTQKILGENYGVHEEGGLVWNFARLLYFAVPLLEPAAPGLYRE